jgi:hypothetical protein
MVALVALVLIALLVAVAARSQRGAEPALEQPVPEPA